MPLLIPDFRKELGYGSPEKKEILYDGYYYDVTDFIKRHPGGAAIIMYFTQPGEDATIPIQQFHARNMDKVQGIMKSLKHRPAIEVTECPVDPETRERNRALTEDFTKLYLELKAEGLFDPSYSHIAYRLIEMSILVLTGIHLIMQYTSIWIRGLGCFILFLGQGRAGWITHESGHLSFTGSPKIDRLIQTYFAGISMGWSAISWRRSHSLHHAMTQRLKRDVDLELTPVSLNNLQVLKDPVKEQNFILRNQVQAIPILSVVLPFFVLFHRMGGALVKYRVVSEFIAVGIHYAIAYQLLGFWPWAFTYWMFSAYLFLNLNLTHTHLPVTDKPTHWVEHGLVHTSDIEQRPWCDWWMGYLNYQIEHHLFPTMPQFKNKLVVERVKALAQKHGLPYHVFLYKEAVIKTVSNLYNIGQSLKAIAKSKSLWE